MSSHGEVTATAHSTSTARRSTGPRRRRRRARRTSRCSSAGSSRSRSRRRRASSSSRSRRRRCSRKEIMHFSRQLSVFVEAGIPIMEALEVIAEETTDKLFKKVLLDMSSELQAGDTFASAAAAHPEAFPRYYVGDPRVSRADRNTRHRPRPNSPTTWSGTSRPGRQDHVGADLPGRGGGHGHRHGHRPGHLRAAEFATFFKSLNAKLPLPTRMLLSVSDFISTGGGPSLA